MNKGYKDAFAITLPRLFIRLVLDIHTTPQGYLAKPGKNDRLIWDDSHRYDWWDIHINSMQHPVYIPEIKFGYSFNNYLVRILNLCITYPALII